MATRVRKAFRKNLFGIVTMVISAAVLLGFLFSSEGLQSLNQISGNIRFLFFCMKKEPPSGALLFYVDNKVNINQTEVMKFLL